MVTKYEYKVLRIGDSNLVGGDGEKTLTELGADGWQIVDILDIGGGGRLFIFTREGPRSGRAEF